MQCTNRTMRVVRRMDSRVRSGIVLLLGLALIAGCVLPAPAPTPARKVATRPSATMQGRVELSQLGRQTQATPGQIAIDATVTLFDSTTNQAIASTVTDGSGAFSLAIPGFLPGSAPYVLEALKGLNSNRANSNAARLRTLVRYSGGTWTSITAPGIVLGRSSTTLCLIAGLKSALPSSQQVGLTSLIGTVTPGTPDTFAPVTNCSAGEYSAVLALTDSELAQDRDPLSGISYDSASSAFRRMGPVAITSATGTFNLQGLLEGDDITLTGSGFDPVPANNTVRFNGVPGVVTSASPTQLKVSMRGLTGGSITVQVGSLVYQGPSYTTGLFRIYDGTNSSMVNVDLAYQYTPLTDGYLHANWFSNWHAIGYQLKVGSSPGAGDVLANVAIGPTTYHTITGLTLQGAWTGVSYYITLTPILPTGLGTPITSNGVQVAEKALWDGQTTTGLRNDSLGGYSINFPPGSSKPQFYGRHYFERVVISPGTTTYVQPFGKVDGISEDASMNDDRVRNPKDGWLALYANDMVVQGTIDASGRGYGGGPGTSYAGVAYHGHGGAGGLSGDGGNANGGLGWGAAGGGGMPTKAGGRSGYFGGAGGGGSDSGAGGSGDDVTAAGGGAYALGNIGVCTGIRVVPGGAAPYGGGIGYQFDNTGGTGGAGYGAGGGGAGGSEPCGGGGGGGTGGSVVGGATTGLGWAPGVLPIASNLAAGNAGRYMPAPDTTIDQRWILGSGGSGGNAGYNAALSPEQTAGGGGGAGGGAIYLQARNLTLYGTSRLIAVGAAGGSGGANSSPGAGGGGGGSGGSIVLVSAALVFKAGSLIDLRGGHDGTPGGTMASGCGAYAGGNGGDGGARTTNGGTLKFFCDYYEGPIPSSITVGRIYYESRE